VLREIGDSYGKTAVQVALRWLIQKPNVVAIPKASSRDHLEQNLAVFDFELDSEAMEAIDNLSN
jgi:diketogulonate reductase-like aldo/keto reductase